MKILAFDTSSASGSVALLDNGRLAAEVMAGDAGTHADWLMRTSDSILRSVSCKINEIDLFAMGIGPGSFTGIRVGISTVKGLAWALDRDVAGVSTLKSLALNLRYSGSLVCPVLDARKGELYASLFSFEGDKIETLLHESALPPDELFKFINVEAGGRHTVFLGNGLKVCSEDVKSRVKEASLAPEPLWHIRASNIALLAYEEYGQRTAPASISPVYLRKSEAEIKTS